MKNIQAKNVILALVSLLVICLLLELVLRIIGFNPIPDFSDGRGTVLRPSSVPEMVYELTPGSKGYVWGAEVEINKFGFRDSEYDTAKPDKTYRIAALGDSVAFGNGLPQPDTFPKQLESMLREAGLQVEVLNMGVGGYDTLQEVVFFEHAGLPLDPDLVIVGYCMNDLGVASVNLEYLEYIERYESPIYRSRLAQLIGTRIGRMKLWRQANQSDDDVAFSAHYRKFIADVKDDVELEHLISLMEAELDSVDRYSHIFEWYISRARIGRLRYCFEKLKRMGDDHDFVVIVVIIPVLDQEFESLYHAAHAIVRHEAERCGFSTSYPYGRFKSFGFRELMNNSRDNIHPNWLGHRVIAMDLSSAIANSLNGGSTESIATESGRMGAAVDDP